MKLALRVALGIFVLCGGGDVFAFQMGQTDYAKAETKVIPLRGNMFLVQIKTPQDLNNIVVLAGAEGYLLVDHPEAVANPIVQKQLDAMGKRPVRFLLNTHWHYDHVGGNEIYGPDAVIVAQENVRKRMVTAQKPPWSPAVIGPYPEMAWPRITFRDSVEVHFAGEDVEMDHYARGHTDGDSVVYFAHANAVDVGDIYNGKGDLAGGIDMQGVATALGAVLERTNDDTVIITGHSDPSNRRDLAKYVELLNATIAQIREGIAAGKTEQAIIAEGLPAAWAPWFAPEKVPAAHDFTHRIYGTLKHTNNLDQ